MQVPAIARDDEEVDRVILPEDEHHVTGSRTSPGEVRGRAHRGELAARTAHETVARLHAGFALEHLKRMVVAAREHERRSRRITEDLTEADEELAVHGRVQVLHQRA